MISKKRCSLQLDQLEWIVQQRGAHCRNKRRKSLEVWNIDIFTMILQQRGDVVFHFTCQIGVLQILCCWQLCQQRGASLFYLKGDYQKLTTFVIVLSRFIIVIETCILWHWFQSFSLAWRCWKRVTPFRRLEALTWREALRFLKY